MHTYKHNNPQSSNSITPSNTDLERVRFSIGVAIFGGTIGGSAIIINFLARFEFPNTPEHMNLISSIFFASSGAIGGILITGPIAYWIYGGLPIFKFTPLRNRGPRKFHTWLLLGIGYGMTLPMVLGILLPIWYRFLFFYSGSINLPTLISSLIDLTMGSLYLAPLLGFQYFFTGIAAGAIFSIGAWTIDHISHKIRKGIIGPFIAWTISLWISGTIISLLLLLPETYLAQIGKLG